MNRNHFHAILLVPYASFRGARIDEQLSKPAQGVELRPEPLERYPRRTLFQAMSDVSRLTPGAQNIRVDVVDEATRNVVSRPVMPSEGNKHDAAVVNRIAAELETRVSRHVVNAGRRAVSDSVYNGVSEIC